MPTALKKYNFGNLFIEAGATTNKLHVIRRDELWLLISEKSVRPIYRSRSKERVIKSGYRVMLKNTDFDTLVLHNYDGSVNQLIPLQYIKNTFLSGSSIGKPRNYRLKKVKK